MLRSTSRPPRTAGTHLTRCRQLLRQRWERLHLDVRCALRADEPQRIRQYLHCGHKLVQLGAVDELTLQLRMLRTLLSSARDTALPPFWCSACLEQARTLLEPLRQHLALHDPLAMQAIEHVVSHGAPVHRTPMELAHGR
jgi:hypothetical protein